MQFFDYEECEQIKETNLYQSRLKEIKAWLGSNDSKSSTIAVLLDSNIYDPLSIIEKWGFQTSNLQVNSLSIVHPEQPVPLKWLVLDISLSINEQILELLLLISIRETKEWRSGNDRYGVSVCLWSKNPHVISKAVISSYTKLGRIDLPTDNITRFKKHYLRYWDSRVFMHLKNILSSSQYLLYRYYLMPCLYMQHNLLWEVSQDKVDTLTDDEKVINKNNIVHGSLKISPTQKDEINTVGLINQCLVLAYKSKDELVNPDMLNNNEIIQSIREYIKISVGQGVKELKHQYIWVLLSLTVHPNFYLHQRVQIAIKNNKLSFTEKMQTINNEDWEIIQRAGY